MVTVHNLNGTSDNLPPSSSSSWREWWEGKKGRKFSKCSRYGCNRQALVGAHVQKASPEASDKWYIVPLCQQCNRRPSEERFNVEDNDLQSVTD